MVLQMFTSPVNSFRDFFKAVFCDKTVLMIDMV